MGAPPPQPFGRSALETFVDALGGLRSATRMERRAYCENPPKGNMDMYISLLVTAQHGKVLNRIILERLKEALVSKLREEQAGFRQHRSCSNLIAG